MYIFCLEVLSQPVAAIHGTVDPISQFLIDGMIGCNVGRCNDTLLTVHDMCTIKEHICQSMWLAVISRSYIASCLR